MKGFFGKCKQAETYLGLCQNSMMKLLAKIFNV